MGRQAEGCDWWYAQYMKGRTAPVFQHRDHFPLWHQVFGTHRIPVPGTPVELETFQYGPSGRHWNATCGVGRNAARCSDLYDRYPFVFRSGDGVEDWWKSCGRGIW